MKANILFLISTLFFLANCSYGPESPKGFRLPNGDAERGKQVFTYYQCPACHILVGDETGEIDIEKELDVYVRLGGEVSRAKTYAELLTSVINPSHKLAEGYLKTTISADGQSKMRNYNDVMTVSELIDLVSFLQPYYKITPYDRALY